MADPADLAGVIGTWVAVALAIIALAGILPVYLVYRAANTEQNTARDDVDDPGHQYISPGLVRWRGKPVSWTLKIPDFKNPPGIGQVRLNLGNGNSALQMQHHHSLTGWVNMANLLRAYGFQNTGTGALEYDRKESYLPVHKGWLLLIGIKGRYDRREDCGVTQGQWIEPEMVNFRRHPSSISGLTGMLCHMPRQQGDLVDAKVYFRMHSASQLASLLPEDIPFKWQLVLFLGFLPGRRGAVYDLQKPIIVGRGAQGRHTRVILKTVHAVQSQGPSEPHRPAVEQALKIWTLDRPHSEPIAPDKRRILHELHVEVPSRLYRIQPSVASDRDKQELRRYGELDDNPFPDSPFYLIEETHEGNPVTWIRKSHLSRLLSAFFDIPASPYSFLGGPGLFDEDSLLSELFKRKHSDFLERFLEREMETIDRLELRDGNWPALREVMKRTLEEKPDDKSWSRGRMSAFYELDEQLRKLFRRRRLTLRVLMTLYALEPTFTAMIHKSTYISSRRLLLDMDKKVVQGYIGDKISAGVWFFEYYKIRSADSVHPNRPSGTAAVKDLVVPFLDAKMACLLAEVRIAMWRMMIPAHHLSSFYDGLDRTVYLSPRTAPSMPTAESVPRDEQRSSRNMEV